MFWFPRIWWSFSEEPQWGRPIFVKGATRSKRCSAPTTAWEHQKISLWTTLAKTQRQMVVELYVNAFNLCEGRRNNFILQLPVVPGIDITKWRNCGDSSGCVLFCISSTWKHSIWYAHFKHSVAYISKKLTSRKQNTCIIHRFSPTDFPTKQAFSLTVSCPVSEPLKSGLYLSSGRMERDNNRERSEKYIKVHIATRQPSIKNPWKESTSFTLRIGMFLTIYDLKVRWSLGCRIMLQAAPKDLSPRYFFFRSSPRSSFCEGGKPFMASTWVTVGHNTIPILWTIKKYIRNHKTYGLWLNDAMPNVVKTWEA